MNSGNFPLFQGKLPPSTIAAANARAVPADELGQRVDDDVRAVLRAAGRDTASRRCCRRRTECPASWAILRDRLEIVDVVLRVADRFGVDQARVLVDRLAEVLRVGANRRICTVIPSFGERVVEQVVGPAVEVAGGDDVLARLAMFRTARSSPPARRRRPGPPTPPSSSASALLQHVGGGVHETGVDVAEFLQPEEVRGVLGAFEDIGGGLVDRHGAGQGGRVGLLAGMECERIESQVFSDIVLSPLS